MIYDALATIREVIAIAEVWRKSMCVMSLDFKGAFDATSHEFLDELLVKYGYSQCMFRRILGLYDGASSSIQKNGHVSAPIGIYASARQGCPLSMLFYAHVIDLLFLVALHEKLPGVRIGRRKTHHCRSLRRRCDGIPHVPRLYSYIGRMRGVNHL
jgi:hypothetical protein